MLAKITLAASLMLATGAYGQDAFNQAEANYQCKFDNVLAALYSPTEYATADPMLQDMVEDNVQQFIRLLDRANEMGQLQTLILITMARTEVYPVDEVRALYNGYLACEGMGDG